MKFIEATEIKDLVDMQIHFTQLLEDWFGGNYDAGDLTVANLLDAFACIGAALIPATENQAAKAYARYLGFDD